MKENVRKRKKILLPDNRVQFKYMIVLVVSMVVPVLVAGGCLYYLIFTIAAEQLGVPESIAINLFPVIHKINIILGLTFPLIFLLLLAWGLILSHRFAGPLERLEREIGLLSKSGDYSKRLRIRKHDDIAPVVNAINRLLDKVEGKSR